MLKLKGITYKIPGEEKEIIKGVDLEFEQGKLYAITGPNGSGKTSLAKIIMGIYKASSGSISFKGEDITSLDINERSQKGIGYAFQYPPRFKGLRVLDLLQLASGIEERNVVRGYLRQVGLCPEDYLERDADASLSGGEMKRIEIATLFAKNPEFTIYDEPDAGVDLWSFDLLLEVIRKKHEKEGLTTVLISHQERILSLVDEIILVVNGKIQDVGTKDRIWPIIKDVVGCQWYKVCRGDEEDETECRR
ncbi:ABC transporter ATP-binding protein [Candidatus Contubernalis alkaliaceticus]|uniref:ABC transporter ATP-binding protein n=1 Tax=Candidatus Contubernalis alkaliaceticus TaxID=338645 RepID=UPI001F4BDF35|nr:ATP-binding cassette domain-containing protein [Candidatus Contubernalis alkalaceticus]UNC91856.1 ATP-binding cassette domain-containing protein [Candidatus Contubernalis alkalaceticus]